MIQRGDGEVLITNDGATILSQLQVFHPTAQMLVQLSKSQDIEAGDGTTGICVIAGALLQACSELLSKGIHPTMIADAFKQSAAKAVQILEGVAKPVDLLDRESVLNAVNTCLSSKVVHNNADVLAPIAVDAVLAVIGTFIIPTEEPLFNKKAFFLNIIIFLKIYAISYINTACFLVYIFCCFE